MPNLTLVRDLWLGNRPLAEAFWRYAIIYGVLLNLAATLAAMSVFSSDAPTAVGVAVYFLPTPYNLFMLVSVWRSAGNYEGPSHWADLARIATAVWVVVEIAV